MWEKKEKKKNDSIHFSPWMSELLEMRVIQHVRTRERACQKEAPRNA